MKDPIFDPIIINKLNIKNSRYFPGMHIGMAKNFEVTDQNLIFYAAKGQGGAAMICTGFATVDEFFGNTKNIGAYDDKFISGLQLLAKTIKYNGSQRGFISIIGTWPRDRLSLIMGELNY